MMLRDHENDVPYWEKYGERDMMVGLKDRRERLSGGPRSRGGGRWCGVVLCSRALEQLLPFEQFASCARDEAIVYGVEFRFEVLATTQAATIACPRPWRPPPPPPTPPFSSRSTSQSARSPLVYSSPCFHNSAWAAIRCLHERFKRSRQSCLRRSSLSLNAICGCASFISATFC